MSDQRATKSVPADAAPPTAPEPAVSSPEDAVARRADGGAQGPPSNEGAQMGTFDEAGKYTPREVVADDLGGVSLEDAIAGTIVEFDDGDIVQGSVVKVDADEVLLDIGFKSGGVIPARELSIRHD